MADLKISALTASTTPLAGTEVLPIVQSSTTKKVSIANVTAGRNVAMLKASISDSTTTTSALLLDLQQASLLDNFETAQIKYGLGSSWTAGFAFKANYGTPALSQSRWQVNGTSYVYLDGNGEMTLASGSLVISTAGKGVSLPGGITWTSGAGSPEGVVTAPIGSIYSRSDGGLLTSFYVKQSGTGNTGWAGK